MHRRFLGSPVNRVPLPQPGVLKFDKPQSRVMLVRSLPVRPCFCFCHDIITTSQTGTMALDGPSCVLIVLVAGILVWLIDITEPTPERVTATKRGAVLVDVVSVERGTYRPVLTVLGTVNPRQELALSPEVGGRVLELSDAFEPGAVVAAGKSCCRLIRRTMNCDWPICERTCRRQMRN